MKIPSTPPSPPKPPAGEKASKPQPEPPHEPQDRFLSQPVSYAATALSLVGGAASLAGGLSRNSAIMAAGLGAFAIGTGLQAPDVKDLNHLDTQQFLSFVVGGSMVFAGAGLLMLGSMQQPAPQEGPLQELLRKPGVQNLFKALP